MGKLENINMQLNLLRKELYKLLSNNATFQEIYDISTQIDALIVGYYKEQKFDEVSNSDTGSNRYIKKEVI